MSAFRRRSLAHVSRRTWPVAATVLVALSAPALSGAQSTTRPRPRPAPTSTLSADSLRADSAAFDALPSSLRELLDVRSRISRSSADPNVVCVALSATSTGSTRQRLQGRLGDGTSLVVFARSSKGGALERVEFVRRIGSGEQRGYTWDREGDATKAMDWPAGSTVSTTYPVPRGGPVPRAIRALGRLVAAWPCR